LISLNVSILIPLTTAPESQGSVPERLRRPWKFVVGSSSKEARPISSPGGINRDKAPSSLPELSDRLLSPVPGGRRSMVSVVRDHPPHGFRLDRRPFLEF